MNTMSFQNLIDLIENELSEQGIYLEDLVASPKLSRKFKRWEVVHHIDGNPSNNKLNNLKLMTNSEHRRMHSLKQPRGDRTWIK